MAMWTLAKKDLRLLMRDARAMVILLAMPLIFILVLGVSLGEGFGQKPDDRLRVSIVDLDRGIPLQPERFGLMREGLAWLATTPAGGPLGGAGLAAANQPLWFPRESWAQVVQRDLAQSAEIRVEIIDNLEKAKELVRSGQRAAVLVFGPDFSDRVNRSSFLDVPDGINPFYRDGVQLKKLDLEILEDQTQKTAVGIIHQVAQGSLLRVVLPWMIGRAFEKIGEPEFIDLLSKQKTQLKVLGLSLNKILANLEPKQKTEFAASLQKSLQALFSKYQLTAKTWAALTKAQDQAKGSAESFAYQEEGIGLLKIGAQRYQVLVPSYTVMFAFFLVLTVGWLFVAERRQGTLKRLVAAPISRTQILLGKLLPCFFVSLFQGLFLLLAGRVLFGMSWGPEPTLLVPVVFTTSLAAMGLALLVAALARTETQVAIYGTLLVLVLAGISGCLMGDRALMPETMQEISRITPHAWALDAYRQLLTNPSGPNLELIGRACAVLTAFGVGFVALAWAVLRLD